MLAAASGLSLGDNVAASFDDDVPYTPAWQESITGVPAQAAERIASKSAQQPEPRERPTAQAEDDDQADQDQTNQTDQTSAADAQSTCATTSTRSPVWSR